MNLKAFIIHLERAKGRDLQVEKLVSELPVAADIIDAVDCQTLSASTIEQVYQRYIHQPRYPFRLSHNEIACFLSHRKAWQAIIDQGLDAGFVLEDDVELTPDFGAAFTAAIAHLRPGDFIRFPFRADREAGTELYCSGNVRIIEPVPVGLGMVAQLVSREAAQKLLDIARVFDRPVDTTLQMSWITGLKPLSVLPGGVREISAKLGGSTIKQNKSLLDKLSREIMRPLYRHQVTSYSKKHNQ